jgi:hypothetical protein
MLSSMVEAVALATLKCSARYLAGSESTDLENLKEKI